MTCRFPNLSPGANKEFDINFDIRKWSSFTNLTDEIGITMEIDNKCASRTQNSDANAKTVTKVLFEYKSDVIVEAVKGASDQYLTYNQTDVAFSHLYKIKNLGPSPTREAISYK